MIPKYQYDIPYDIVSNWYFRILQAVKMFRNILTSTYRDVPKVSYISVQYAKHFHHARMEIPCRKLLFLQENTSPQTERAVK